MLTDSLAKRSLAVQHHSVAGSSQCQKQAQGRVRWSMQAPGQNRQSLATFACNWLVTSIVTDRVCRGAVSLSDLASFHTDTCQLQPMLKCSEHVCIIETSRKRVQTHLRGPLKVPCARPDRWGLSPDVVPGLKMFLVRPCREGSWRLMTARFCGCSECR